MTANDPPALPETLKLHSGWMRRLARSLVRDDAQADDVVQDAMVAALRKPPRDAAALPAWLAATVRNGARVLWRGQSRRSARETAAARHEATSSAVEVVARAEEHGLVVKAVLALDEPYRSSVLLRFFDDLPPREVAKRTGVPVETARARIRRGLEKLRGELDTAHGGDGREWRLALVPLMFPRGAVGAGAGTGAAAGPKLTGAIVMAGNGAVVGTAGVALVAGAFVGWCFGNSKVTAAQEAARVEVEATKKLVQSETAKVADRDDKVKRQAEQISELTNRLRTANEETDAVRASLEEKVARLETELADARKGPAPAKPVAKGPRFAFDQYGKLGDVDWKSVGEHLAAITPLIAEITDAIEKKDDAASRNAQGRAAQHNGFLINAAVKILGQVPGTGVNGAYTHPAFQANAIAAALDAAGKPLSPEETSAFERIARQFTDEDVRRLQGYDESTYGMQKVIDEADLRGRFFDAVFDALPEEKRLALRAPGTRGLIGLDLYSEGLLWATLLQPVPLKEKEMGAFAESVTRAVVGGLRLPRDRSDAVNAVVAAWARDLPRELVDPQSDLHARPGTIPVATVRTAAVQTLALLKSVVTELKLEDAPAKAARRWTNALLPMPSEE